jgi:hypothetical protein
VEEKVSGCALLDVEELILVAAVVKMAETRLEEAEKLCQELRDKLASAKTAGDARTADTAAADPVLDIGDSASMTGSGEASTNSTESSSSALSVEGAPDSATESSSSTMPIELPDQLTANPSSAEPTAVTQSGQHLGETTAGTSEIEGDERPHKRKRGKYRTVQVVSDNEHDEELEDEPGSSRDNSELPTKQPAVVDLKKLAGM